MKNNEPKIQLNQRAYNFSVVIIKFVRNYKNSDFTLREIFKQLIRSATSIGANLFEAKGGSSRKDFILFFTHAMKSSIETCYWLQLLKDTYGYSSINSLLDECQEISRIIAKSIITLRKNSK